MNKQLCFASLLLCACFSPNDPLIVTTGSDDSTADASGDPTTASSTISTTLGTATEPTDGSDPSTDPTPTSADDTSTAGAAVCGNGEVEGEEVCDDGENDGSYGGCKEDCTALGPHCGDGVTNGDEPCDDGDEVNGNGCNLDCVVSGTVLWTVTYDGNAHGSDQGNGVAVDDADNVFVAGSESSGGTPRGWLRAFDADGNASWTEVHASAAGGVNYTEVTVDPDGDVVVAGSAAATGQGNNAVVRKYNFDGDTLWTEMFDDGDALDQVANGIGTDLEGYFAESGTDDGDIFVRRLDENGNEMWRDTVDGIGTDSGRRLAIDSEGNIVVVGLLSEPEGSRIWTRKYNSNGNTVWTRIADEAGNGSMGARDVAVDADGSVYVAAFMGDSEVGSTYVRKYDSGGDEIWTNDGSGGDVEMYDVGAVVVDSAGNLIATGLAGPSISEIGLVKYDATGALRWGEMLTADTGFSVGRNLAIDSHDNILVAGNSLVETTDIFVAKVAP
ncbi:MAG: hypothetical protein IAG13_24160 [Deltaproteobacteria bacterium]|nr:hypothetical protein [Nannocystaceae bacterium]